MGSGISREQLQVTGRTPTVDSVTLTLANTEYTFALPAKTVKYRIQLVGQSYDLFYSYASGGTFISIPAGSPGLTEEFIHTGDSTLTIYLKCVDAAGQIVRVEYWLTE